MSFLDECRAFVGVESTPAHGTHAAVVHAAELARRAGLVVEVAAEVRGEVHEANLIARPATGRPAGEVILQTRLDTAPAGHFGQWTKTRSNPFDASIYGETMYGLGVADAKLDFICKLEAARGFVGRDLKLPFALLGTFAGQGAMTGAIQVIRQKKINATFALVGEPTELKLVHAGAGLATLEILVPFSPEERAYRREHDLHESTSSQSRVFHAGGRGDALTHLFEYLANLPTGIALMDLDAGEDRLVPPTQAVLEIDSVASFRDPILPKLLRVRAAVQDLARAMTAHGEEGLEPAHPTAHLSLARTNDDGVLFTGACRLPPGLSEATFATWTRALDEACVEVGATFSVKEYRGGFKTDPARGIVKGAQDILREMGLDFRLRKQAVTSEANVFTRSGIECVVWGPGRGAGNSHVPNERVEIGELHAAVDFYRRMIERFCP